VLEEEPRSVASGRSMDEIAQGRGGKRVWQSNRGATGKAAKTSGKKAAQLAKRDAATHRGATRAPRRPTSSANKSKSTRNSKAKAKILRRSLPDFVPPALAILRAAAAADAGWRSQTAAQGRKFHERTYPFRGLVPPACGPGTRRASCRPTFIMRSQESEPCGATPWTGP
jgi:hypothetical protein